MTTRAPIALFVYNRPGHTRQTVEALLASDASKQSDLIVYSDAPKSDQHVDAVNQVRDFIRRLDGFKSIKVIEREHNHGLAGSIIDGVTSVVNDRGRVIVLEDDLVVAPCFLDYMNAALDLYADDGRAMHVSGYMFPVDNRSLPETLFLRISSCWGWATWADAWENFEPDGSKLLDEINNRGLRHEFDLHGTKSYSNMLKSQVQGKNDSWAVRWYASVFLKRGLCLHPAVSLVNNLGHDGSGTHCEANDIYGVELPVAGPAVERLKLEESAPGLEAIENFYRSNRRSFPERVASGLLRRVRNWK